MNKFFPAKHFAVRSVHTVLKHQRSLAASSDVFHKVRVTGQRGDTTCVPSEQAGSVSATKARKRAECRKQRNTQTHGEHGGEKPTETRRRRRNSHVYEVKPVQLSSSCKIRSRRKVKKEREGNSTNSPGFTPSLGR